MIHTSRREVRRFNTYKGYEAMIYIVGEMIDLAVKTPF